MQKRLIAFFLTCLFVQSAQAQKEISGTIRNAQTGEALPYANIQVMGSFYGTISNREGKFNLKLRDLPDTLLIRYIGFVSQEVIVTEQSPSFLTIELQPTVLEMQPVVVTAEDPAVTIMREVIRRKQIWRKNLLSFTAKGYSRIRLENDTAIVFISEATSNLYWDKNKGSREVITGKKETANLPADAIFAHTSYLPNFYDDDIEVQGTKVIGPTHPQALKYYRFRLLGQRKMDDQVVFDIEVKPKGKLQPTFEGRVSVLDEVYAMIDVDLRPGQAVKMPFPIDSWSVAHRQQFSDFGQGVWLPVDVRISGDIKISFPGLNFPLIRYHQVSRITDYQVNVLLPDSLYRQKRIVTMDTLAVQQDTLLEKGGLRVPLTSQEEMAYATIDSTMTLEKAFQPTGFLAWLARIQVDAEESQSRAERRQRAQADSTRSRSLRSFFTGVRPVFGFNRVDGFYLGLGWRKTVSRYVRLFAAGNYKFSARRWGGQAEARFNFDRRGRHAVSISYRDDTLPRYASFQYPALYLNAASLLGMYDYLDYYQVKGWEFSIFARKPNWRNLRLKAGLRVQEHRSVPTTVKKDIWGGTKIQLANPAVSEGKLRSVCLRVDFGNEYVPFGIVGQRGARLEIERALPRSRFNDFSFTRVAANLYWQIPTFLKRRLLPNTLELYLVGGMLSGDAPLQRYGILDVRSGAFSPFAVFKTLGLRPLQGKKWAAVYWEHNFRTAPFELLGLRALADRNISFLIYGASGRTALPRSVSQRLPEPLHDLRQIDHEIGFSLSGLWDVFRLDVTFPLTRKGVYLGFGFARII